MHSSKHGISPVSWTNACNWSDGEPPSLGINTRNQHGLAHPRPFSAGAARRQETDSRAGAFVWPGFLSRHLRDVRLGTDEPDRRVWRIPSALSALAIRRGI